MQNFDTGPSLNFLYPPRWKQHWINVSHFHWMSVGGWGLYGPDHRLYKNLLAQREIVCGFRMVRTCVGGGFAVLKRALLVHVLGSKAWLLTCLIPTRLMLILFVLEDLMMCLRSIWSEISHATWLRGLHLPRLIKLYFFIYIWWSPFFMTN